MAIHFSILAWRIPWTERNLAGYSPLGCKELDMTEGLTFFRASQVAQWVKNAPAMQEAQEMRV